MYWKAIQGWPAAIQTSPRSSLIWCTTVGVDLDHSTGIKSMAIVFATPVILTLSDSGTGGHRPDTCLMQVKSKVVCTALAHSIGLESGPCGQMHIGAHRRSKYKTCVDPLLLIPIGPETRSGGKVHDRREKTTMQAYFKRS